MCREPLRGLERALHCLSVLEATAGQHERVNRKLRLFFFLPEARFLPRVYVRKRSLSTLMAG